LIQFNLSQKRDDMTHLSVNQNQIKLFYKNLNINKY
jgi:hypothetical protein